MNKKVMLVYFIIQNSVTTFMLRYSCIYNSYCTYVKLEWLRISKITSHELYNGRKKGC